MAVSTYAELQTAIANYLDRSDLTTRIPEFITLAEAKLNRKLRLKEMHELSTKTLTSASRLVDKPAGCMEIFNIDAKKASEADTEYEPLTSEYARFMYKHYGTGEPEYYTERSQIEIDKTVSEDWTLRFDCLIKWDIATDSTNWLLTNYPDAYLYGSMLEAEMYVKNDSRFQLWQVNFAEVMKELNELDDRVTDESVMESDIVRLTNRNTFNIITD